MPRKKNRRKKIQAERRKNDLTVRSWRAAKTPPQHPPSFDTSNIAIMFAAMDLSR